MVRSTEAVAADAARAVGPGRVVYLSPILIEAFFARPTALCAPQCVERSDQIEGTGATCAHTGGGVAVATKVRYFGVKSAKVHVHRCADRHQTC